LFTLDAKTEPLPVASTVGQGESQSCQSFAGIASVHHPPLGGARIQQFGYCHCHFFNFLKQSGALVKSGTMISSLKEVIED